MCCRSALEALASDFLPLLIGFDLFRTTDRRQGRHRSELCDFIRITLNGALLAPPLRRLGVR